MYIRSVHFTQYLGSIYNSEAFIGNVGNIGRRDLGCGVRFLIQETRNFPRYSGIIYVKEETETTQQNKHESTIKRKGS